MAFFKVGRRAAPQVEWAPGMPAGTLVHLGEQMADEIHFSVTDYGRETVTEAEPTTVSEIPIQRAADSKVRWIHIAGLHDVAKIAEVGERFGIPALVLEDILNPSCRPRIEEFIGGIFVLLRLLTDDAEHQQVDLQQVAFVLLENNLLLSFSEVPAAAFEPVRQRVRTGGGGRIRKAGGDYLLWALFDVVVDHYLRVTDAMDEALSSVDEQLQAGPELVSAADISRLKSEVTALFRHIRPCREIASVLNRAVSPLIATTTGPYLRDLNDHAIQVVEAAEDLRETAAALRDFYHTAMSNRMNEVMKVLTCFSTIFLPLTFLAGIYGMNFEYMPELKWQGSYGVLWVVFVLIALGMFWLFRKKRWL